MHVFDQNLVVEILDRERPVPAGGIGEIVLTHLDAWAMPLLRYRTGDLASRIERRCPCGRGMGLLGPVQGRRTDHLVAADGSLKHALAAIYVLREVATVRQFQIYQDPRRHLHVQLVPGPGFRDADEALIRNRLRKRFGAALPVTIRRVTSIGPAGSGKHRHVVSDAVAEIAHAPIPAEEVVA
jgi:phenylacetate-CoA ligase